MLYLLLLPPASPPKNNTCNKPPCSVRSRLEPPTPPPPRWRTAGGQQHRQHAAPVQQQRVQPRVRLGQNQSQSRPKTSWVPYGLGTGQSTRARKLLRQGRSCIQPKYQPDSRSSRLVTSTDRQIRKHAEAVPCATSTALPFSSLSLSSPSAYHSLSLSPAFLITLLPSPRPRPITIPCAGASPAAPLVSSEGARSAPLRAAPPWDRG